ncbi:DUF805 domain-containing protein [Patescibacteria group bacterium]|nr:DUF805 domain-containing protein [Patescibacteria group bacterium]
MHWFIDPIKNHYADFDGRVGRQEYWMFVLFNVLLSFAFEIVGLDVLSMLVGLALLVPSLALASRRLHDIGRSGWWQLLLFIPIIGWIILIVWMVTKTEPIDNAYGAPAVPKTGPEGTPEVPVATAAAPVVEIDTPASMTETMDVTPDVPASASADSSAGSVDSAASK